MPGDVAIFVVITADRQLIALSLAHAHRVKWDKRNVYLLQTTGKSALTKCSIAIDSFVPFSKIKLITYSET